MHGIGALAPSLITILKGIRKETTCWENTSAKPAVGGHSLPLGFLPPHHSDMGPPPLSLVGLTPRQRVSIGATLEPKGV